MASIRDIHNPWRDSLVIASFRGAQFHTETSGRRSGRRVVVHQYPKRNIPYSEDLGREAIKWSFTGYLIQGDRGLPGNVMSQLDDLISALESDDAGFLIHPLIGAMLVLCDNYSYADKRTAGGYFEFDMQFVEAGTPAGMPGIDAGGQLSDAAGGAEQSAASNIKTDTASLQNVPIPQPRPTAVT
jgi:prophage DNA circulation protein